MVTALTSRPVEPRPASAHPTEPWRLAFVSSGELFGGVEQFLVTLSLYLKEKTNIEPIVFLFNRGVLFDKLQNAGIRVEVVDAWGKYNPITVRKLKTLFQQTRIDLVHTHGYKAAVVGGLAGRWAGIKVIKTEHGDIEPGSYFSTLKMRLNLALDKWITRRLMDRVVFITHDLLARKPVRDRFGKAVVIHNGISTPDLPLETPSLKTPGKVLFGIVGRLTPVKGHHLLLEALTHLRHRLSFEVVVLGDGPLKNLLEAEVRRLNLTDSVRFLGFRPNADRCIAALDCLLMPSLHEGLPYTLLEAMHAGVPVIASDVGGLREVLRHQQTGLLFTPGDAAALARLIDEVIERPEIRRKIGTAARRQAITQYNIASMANRYLHLYRRLRRNR